MADTLSSPAKKKCLFHLRFRSDILVFVLLALQFIFWLQVNGLKPEMDVVPNVPGQATIQAMSLGDEEFYFRVLAVEMQNMGDLFGNFTALKYYNYKKLAGWFDIMDSLDSTSNFIPALASYYFSQTQNKPDVRYIIHYLDKHASRDIGKKWWWMGQAVYLANFVLNDTQWALRLAYSLAKATGPDVPMWARQMPAFIHEKLGENEQAFLIIDQILKHEKNIKPDEKRFMDYFINERLHKIIRDSHK